MNFENMKKGKIKKEKEGMRMYEVSLMAVIIKTISLQGIGVLE